MTQIFETYGRIIISVIMALVIMATALWFDDTEYENAWLYVFCIYLFISAAFDVYSQRKNKV